MIAIFSISVFWLHFKSYLWFFWRGLRP